MTNAEYNIYALALHANRRAEPYVMFAWTIIRSSPEAEQSELFRQFLLLTRYIKTDETWELPELVNVPKSKGFRRRAEKLMELLQKTVSSIEQKNGSSRDLSDAIFELCLDIERRGGQIALVMMLSIIIVNDEGIADETPMLEETQFEQWRDLRFLCDAHPLEVVEIFHIAKQHQLSPDETAARLMPIIEKSESLEEKRKLLALVLSYQRPSLAHKKYCPAFLPRNRYWVHGELNEEQT